MVSVKGWLAIIKLGPRMVCYILRYLFVGSPFRKFKGSFFSTISMAFYRWVISLPIRDARIVSFIKNKTLLRSIIPLLFKPLTSQYHNYGKQFDEKSYWLFEKPDRKPSDPVLIYLHGGGYFIQTSPSQIASVFGIHQLLEPEKRKNLSILFLDYSLACYGHTFPTQLTELDATYTKLAAGCSNIVLMGDSAGGHLAITYTQKLKYDNISDKPYPSKLILISPWVKLMPDARQFTPKNSYYDNNGRDILEFKIMRSPEMIVGEEPLQSLIISPGNKLPHSRDDWSSIPTYGSAESDVFVLVGEDEVFRDDVLEWCEYALGVPLHSEQEYGHSGNFFDPKTHAFHRKGGPEGAGVRVYVEPWGVHDASLYFESSLLRNILKRGWTMKDVDQERYFGLYRAAKFLNDKL